MSGRRRRPIGVAAVGALWAAAAVASSVTAHGPDPALSGPLWSPNQALTYQWKAGQVPPDWLATAIDNGAADASATRGSRAATFRRAASAASQIAYGEPTGCSPAGIACFDRSGSPSSFRVWFRAHGYVFDWGALRWCQALVTIANGCFDAETIALDELGHVEGLGHHVNFGDNSDYLDAVVQALSAARPNTGWQAHAFGRCDVARLQLGYDRRDPGDPISTCLAIPTTTGLSASATKIWIGDTIQFTATLRTTSAASSGALANDPVSDRVVALQRRPVGATTWTSMGTLPASTSTEGTYMVSMSPTATYDWRAVFAPAAGDGALASTSAVVRVSVSGCTGAGCPSRPVP